MANQDGWSGAISDAGILYAHRHPNRLRAARIDHAKENATDFRQWRFRFRNQPVRKASAIETARAPPCAYPFVAV
ncbi:hypothetical protein, partial [Burkholderia sp.]|uniref:hypothetical protein n=1 Tax=Burkholderia sp. TaxID=36773 RepID=UPI003464D91F